MESHATTARLTTPVWRRLSTDHKALAERELAEDLAAADVSTEVVVVSGDPLTRIIETADSYISMALDSVLSGKTVEKAKTKPYGCGVKYAK